MGHHDALKLRKFVPRYLAEQKEKREKIRHTR
jgi:hypothetical protein